MSTVNEQLIFSPSLSASRTEEKAVLGVLNNRFVNYIGKVQSLTDQNHWLEKNIKQLENAPSISSQDSSYEAFKSTQLQLQQAVLEQARSEIALERCCKKLEICHKRLIQEEEDRKRAEIHSTSLRNDVDQATLARVALEEQAEALKEELDLVKSNDDKNFRGLMEKLLLLRNREVDEIQMVETLSNSVQPLRCALDDLLRKSKCGFETLYLQKIDNLTAKLKIEKEMNEINSSKLIAMKKQIRTASWEIDKLRSKRNVLQHQIKTADMRYQNELDDQNNTMENARQKLISTKHTRQRQLERYSELVNIKVKLDSEIESYRNLLECEEISLKGHEQLHFESNLLSQDEAGSDDDDIEKRDYCMKRHYYSLFPLGMDSNRHGVGMDSNLLGVGIIDSNTIAVGMDSPGVGMDSNYHAETPLATPHENLSADVFESETDFHGVMLVKESVRMHNPLLEDCRTSCRSETWSVEAVEVDLTHDDLIHGKEDVFHQEALT